MDRLVRFNVLAMSGRAVEAAGDVDTLLLDKTGTITLGNRQATEFCRCRRHRARAGRRGAARLAADETPEGRSIVVLAKEKYGIRGRDMAPLNATSFRSPRRPASAASTSTARRSARARSTRARLWRGSPARRRAQAAPRRRRSPRDRRRIAKSGGTPLAVAKDGKLLGVIHLKDIVKGGIRERFAALRRWASAP
jgi:K+-transporting ATPase ATPase B chain